ncbi:VOC family protein [Mangrovitalea sediminis]|uniref:VOC family protein n=1 Tax=Mangrovitalea sediminis TaxID=1982043 RepID=UPI000BE56DC3|nr:VOC family protein [Mangrovitalea sediminis]
MTTTQISPFHIAIPVRDLDSARKFYGDLLGCPEGRSTDQWIDFNFYGHQVVTHLAPDEACKDTSNEVEGHAVPVRHFGAVLKMEEWEQLADRLQAAGTNFIIAPDIRFKGEPGEQATMFFRDPSGNAVEMKAFADISALFAK